MESNVRNKCTIETKLTDTITEEITTAFDVSSGARLTQSSRVFARTRTMSGPHVCAASHRGSEPATQRRRGVGVVGLAPPRPCRALAASRNTALYPRRRPDRDWSQRRDARPLQPPPLPPLAQLLCHRLWSRCEIRGRARAVVVCFALREINYARPIPNVWQEHVMWIANVRISHPLTQSHAQESAYDGEL